MMNDMLILLSDYYSEKGRYLHDLCHIGYIFKIARNLEIELTDVQKSAIWFHDSIYDPKRKDNEEKSAEFGFEYAKQFMPLKDALLVKQIILDTKEEIPTTEQSGIVIDLDLHWLETDNYDLNSHLVRCEYNHLSEEEWIEGRSKWILSFLDRKTIFVTGRFGEHAEKRARKNLENEYNQLQWRKENG